MNLEDAMADAILRAILARPILSTVQDGRIPSELWNTAYDYEKARVRYENQRAGNLAGFVFAKRDYRAALEKFADVLPEILKNLSTENE